jgi:hypothetical protein
MLTPEIIERLKAAHPNTELHELAFADGSVVVRLPSRSEYRMFQSIVTDRSLPEGLEYLLNTCVVHPDAAAVAALFERRPGLVNVLGNKLAGLAGSGAQVEAKKL